MLSVIVEIKPYVVHVRTRIYEYSVHLKPKIQEHLFVITYKNLNSRIPTCESTSTFMYMYVLFSK